MNIGTNVYTPSHNMTKRLLAQRHHRLIIFNTISRKEHSGKLQLLEF